MSPDAFANITPWASIVFSAFAIAAACGAVTARSLVSMASFLFVTAAMAAAALLSLRADAAALDLALIGAGLAPALVLAILLLSSRSTKSQKRMPPWVTTIAAGGLCAAILALAPRLPALPAQAAASESGVAFWLAPIVLVAGVSCLGLLGFGERGALTRLFDGEGGA